MGAKQSSSSGDLAVQQQNRESVDSDPVHRSPWAIEARVTTGERSQSRDRPVSASFIRSRRYRERMSDDSDLGGFAVWEPQSLPTALNMLRYDRGMGTDTTRHARVAVSRCERANWFLLAGIKCPVCSKKLTSDVLESHLAECLAKPRLTYNGESCCWV